MPAIVVDWEGLARELRGEVVEGLRGLVEGSEEDLQEFGAAIARDTIRAVRDSRADLESELGHQLEALAELNRIRAVNATWDRVKSFIAIVGRIAMKAIAAAAVAA